MTVARPPVVSQTEWDAVLAAMTEREETVATAMQELAAARHDEFDEPPPSASSGNAGNKI